MQIKRNVTDSLDVFEIPELIGEFYHALDTAIFSIVMQLEGPLVLISFKSKLRENGNILQLKDTNQGLIQWKGETIITFSKPQIQNGYLTASFNPLIKEIQQ